MTSEERELHQNCQDEIIAQGQVAQLAQLTELRSEKEARQNALIAGLSDSTQKSFTLRFQSQSGREALEELAAEHGLSLNAYLNKLVMSASKEAKAELESPAHLERIAVALEKIAAYMDPATSDM